MLKAFVEKETKYYLERRAVVAERLAQLRGYLSEAVSEGEMPNRERFVDEIEVSAGLETIDQVLKLLGGIDTSERVEPWAYLAVSYANAERAGLGSALREVKEAYARGETPKMDWVLHRGRLAIWEEFEGAITRAKG